MNRLTIETDIGYCILYNTCILVVYLVQFVKILLSIDFIIHSFSSSKRNKKVLIFPTTHKKKEKICFDELPVKPSVVN